MNIAIGDGTAINTVSQDRVTIAVPLSDPSGIPIGGEAAEVAVSQDQASSAASSSDPAETELDRLCGELMTLQRDRCFAINQQIRSNNATLAYIRTRLGFSTFDVEERRTALVRRARAIKAQVEAALAGERGKNGEAPALDPSLPPGIVNVVRRNIEVQAGWTEMRAETEAQMERLAADLPVVGFVAATPGLSLKGLAVIVGEAGNLAGYPKIGHLWRRLGLAVIDGRRQGSLPPGISREQRVEEWLRRGYNPRRRAQVYAFIDDVFFRCQRPGSKYRAYYERKKGEYIAREKSYPDRSARRAMAKLLIRDLWRAWRTAFLRKEPGAP
jgi:septum formation topological specificity factor MinE